MNSYRILLLAAGFFNGVLMLAACDHQPTEYSSAKAYGLGESTVGREVFEDAVNIVSQILGDTDEITLVCAWSEQRTGAANEVPLYLIPQNDLAQTDRIFVPGGERCIFASDGVIPKLRDLFFETDESMAVAPEKYLALILLHELGHVHHEHSGSYAAPTTLPDSSFNLRETDQKSRELEADRFAADRIAEAAAAQDSFDRNIAASDLKLALSYISMNIQRFLLIDNFGSNSTFSPNVYWDRGYSHPNLALRMLIIQALLDGTEDTQAFVDQFIASRERKPIQLVFVDISSVNQLAELVVYAGHKIERSTDDPQELVVTYGATGERAIVRLDSNNETKAIAEIAEYLGIEFIKPDP